MCSFIVFLLNGVNRGFDYRPFVINWCMSVKVIDGYVVDAIERYGFFLTSPLIVCIIDVIW